MRKPRIHLVPADQADAFGAVLLREMANRLGKVVIPAQGSTQHHERAYWPGPDVLLLTEEAPEPGNPEHLGSPE